MSKSKQVKVAFSPSGKHGRFPVGTKVLQAARDLGVDIDSICSGRSRCGRCQVTPVEGRFAREGMVCEAGNLGPLSGDETECVKSGILAEGNRLSCQARVLGDVRLDVPPGSQVHRQVVRKDYEAHPIEIDPVVHLYFTRVSEPDLENPEGDLQRLLRALERDHGLTGLQADSGVVGPLQSALRENDWQVTAAVRDGRRIVAVWPGFQGRIFGAAVDVGSTTLAASLCDLASGEVLASAGAMNPQIRFGEDLMSRVSYAMQNPGGAERMTDAVRSAIDELLAGVMREAGVKPDQVLEVTLVGNPVMHHLLLGLDPAPLGAAPFALATSQAVEVPARQLGLNLASAARAYTLPCIAGFVGADTAAVLLAETPWERDEVSLIIDVGTNAELVLGNRERLLAASSPTGPAFEGAQVSGGQRAARGAIERVRIDPETLEPRYKVVGGSLWSDEPGFEGEIGCSGVSGICGSGIIEAVAGMYLAGILGPDGLIDGAMAGRNGRIERRGRTFSYLLHRGDPAIRIHQKDVRAIQLAKAALYAGARLLMKRMGVDKVDRIRLAGAFGAHIDVRYAMVLGMIPDCKLENASAAGNAAGTGARIALLSAAERRRIETRVLGVEKVETSVQADFQDLFVEAMAIPHAVDGFPQLAAGMKLPERRPRASTAVSRRR